MKKRHVLLIDDNNVDSFINKHIVTKSQISEKITVKNSAIKALEFLEDMVNKTDDFPDLIFLDIGMPIMNGFDFLEEFIKFPSVIDNKCSVVMLTSSNDQNDIDLAKSYPVVKEYFVKPLKLEMVEKLDDVRYDI